MAAERITIDQSKKGDVLTFFYSSGHDPRPTILFLNNYKGLIHGLNLNYLSATQTQYLSTILSNKLYSLYSIENPKDFYDNQIKKYGFGVAYRTYKPEKMIQIFRIGYKMKSLEKDLGLKKPEEKKPKPTLATSKLMPEHILPPKLLPEQLLPSKLMPEHILPPKLLPDKILPDRLLPDHLFPTKK